MEPTAVSTARSHTAELAAVRERRAELRETLGALEQALASPAVGRPLIWGERRAQRRWSNWPTTSARTSR